MLINGPCDGLDVLIEHELSIMFGMGLCKEQDEINIYTTTIASDNTEVFFSDSYFLNPENLLLYVGASWFSIWNMDLITGVS